MCTALRAVGAALVLLGSAGCGTKDGAKYASAGVTAGAAVAVAGVNRAVTGDCWADCRPGFRCDRDKGTCVAIPCGGRCGTDERCVPSETGEVCVRAARDTASPAAPEPTASAAASAPVDPCRGLCFARERCVVDAGVANCVETAGR